jgi:glutamyl-tRNA synthetase
LALPFVERIGWVATPPTAPERATLRAIVEAAHERLKLAGDILDYDEFFVADDGLAYDEKAFDKRVRNAAGAAQLLGEVCSLLAGHAEFTVASLEHLLHEFVEARGLGLGQIVHALRLAVSGKAVGFGLFDILAILGRERVLARIDRALARL